MSKKSIKASLPCYASHKPMDLVVGGGVYRVYGGSCIHPAYTEANVYVGLDVGMSAIPFRGNWAKHPEQIYYPIQDMSVPDNVATFKALVFGLLIRIQEGKAVHIGCIGGHGRTGLVLAALVKIATGNKDAIDYVRKNYCKHAVETYEQVMWLCKHFDLNEPESTHPKVSLFHGLQDPSLYQHAFTYSVKPVEIAQHFRIL